MPNIITFPDFAFKRFPYLQIWRGFILEGIGLEGFILQIWRVFYLEGICLEGFMRQLWRVWFGGFLLGGFFIYSFGGFWAGSFFSWRVLKPSKGWCPLLITSFRENSDEEIYTCFRPLFVHIPTANCSF